jgi:hypothetical protein
LTLWQIIPSDGLTPLRSLKLGSFGIFFFISTGLAPDLKEPSSGEVAFHWAQIGPRL